MSIGYACQAVGVADTRQRTCTAKNISKDKLIDLISHNLKSLSNIIAYNKKNDIELFRISSDLIPFGSSVLNDVSWWEIFKSDLSEIGEKIKQAKIRVSMHPGQYTVLNSPNDSVVKNAIEDLKYHNRVLDSLNMGREHKIILHIGGIYSDKKGAIDRFIANYQRLPQPVKDRLVIENDDKSYNIDDVIAISNILKIPVIFDNLHNQINPSEPRKSDAQYIEASSRTWGEKDGGQKIHYSQQHPLKRLGSHSDSIKLDEFMHFYETIDTANLDIMLEVKDKNLSAVKCINATTQHKEANKLEIEWAKYKYLVLEHSPLHYPKIEKLLCDKNEYPVIEFYNLIECALAKERTTENSISAALHIWEHFTDISTSKEKEDFIKIIEKYQQGRTSVKVLKGSLYQLADKYHQAHLLDSYYFIIS